MKILRDFFTLYIRKTANISNNKIIRGDSVDDRNLEADTDVLPQLRKDELRL